MIERVFRHLGEAQMRVFKRDDPAAWLRPGGPEDGNDLQIRFVENWMPKEVLDIEMLAPQPVAWVLEKDVLAIDPDRVVDLDILFTKADRLIISGRRYAIESCSSDGYGTTEVRLKRVSA
ncbi:hypothetical protein [Rhizobium laguerreae]|uniref:hypothetical protein n=1 Tax=Rhizobium laguerreae TaxID=1076926 RepID=UPI001C903415|nr:hypothetical protein [Rhizobium laguerreae]MBY3363751.1 hypothetical protein [Rhizobium laguerreae]